MVLWLLLSELVSSIIFLTSLVWNRIQYNFQVSSGLLKKSKIKNEVFIIDDWLKFFIYPYYRTFEEIYSVL